MRSQMSRLESELAAEWRDKSDRLLSVERDRHARALREVADEKQQLQEKLQAQQDKVQHVTSGVVGDVMGSVVYCLYMYMYL